MICLLNMKYTSSSTHSFVYYWLIKTSNRILICFRWSTKIRWVHLKFQLSLKKTFWVVYDAEKIYSPRDVIIINVIVMWMKLNITMTVRNLFEWRKCIWVIIAQLIFMHLFWCVHEWSTSFSQSPERWWLHHKLDMNPPMKIHINTFCFSPND
jgi:hypothetical protein